MGYDLELIEEQVLKELICSICAGVLQDPLQIQACEHAFCKVCISTWFAQNPTCPIDRRPAGKLTPVPRITRSLLSSLSIKCDFPNCDAVVKLEYIESHKSSCGHRLNAVELPIQEGHNRSTYLADAPSDGLIHHQAQQEDEFMVNIEALPFAHHRNWYQTLPVAVVNLWDAYNRNPDQNLKQLAKCKLASRNCPWNVANDLVESNFQMQGQQILYPSYQYITDSRWLLKCEYVLHYCQFRLIDEDLQAVLLLKCENSHMDGMIDWLDSGCVFFFDY